MNETSAREMVMIVVNVARIMLMSMGVLLLALMFIAKMAIGACEDAEGRRCQLLIRIEVPTDEAHHER